MGSRARLTRAVQVRSSVFTIELRAVIRGGRRGAHDRRRSERPAERSLPSAGHSPPREHRRRDPRAERPARARSRFRRHRRRLGSRWRRSARARARPRRPSATRAALDGRRYDGRGGRRGRRGVAGRLQPLRLVSRCAARSAGDAGVRRGPLRSSAHRALLAAGAQATGAGQAGARRAQRRGGDHRAAGVERALLAARRALLAGAAHPRAGARSGARDGSGDRLLQARRGGLRRDGRAPRLRRAQRRAAALAQRGGAAARRDLCRLARLAAQRRRSGGAGAADLATLPRHARGWSWWGAIPRARSGRSPPAT